MVQAMEHEAVKGDMDQEAVELRRSDGWCKGAIDGTSDGTRSSRRRYGSGSCRRSDGWCKRWKERWMVQAMDHETVEGDMDQEAVEGAMDGTSDGTRSSRKRYGSGSCRRSDGWFKRWKER